MARKGAAPGLAVEFDDDDSHRFPLVCFDHILCGNAVFEEVFGRTRLESSIAWVAANGPTFHNLRVEVESLRESDRARVGSVKA